MIDHRLFTHRQRGALQVDQGHCRGYSELEPDPPLRLLTPPNVADSPRKALSVDGMRGGVRNPNRGGGLPLDMGKTTAHRFHKGRRIPEQFSM